LTHIAQLPLIGSYEFDDQGVRAQAVRLVNNGVLQTLLSSRTPSTTVIASNGHGRAGGMGEARGRIANLWLRNRSGLEPSALRRMLLDVAKKERMPHAIVVTRLDDTGQPLETYRVGRQGNAELVRGAVVHGLRARDLRQIIAAGRDTNVYSYWASATPWQTPGGSSGTIPTTIAAPSVLFPDVDIMAPVPPYAPLHLAPRYRDSTKDHGVGGQGRGDRSLHGHGADGHSKDCGNTCDHHPSAHGHSGIRVWLQPHQTRCR
jgi:predicted Zn-dependent protease